MGGITSDTYKVTERLWDPANCKLVYNTTNKSFHNWYDGRNDLGGIMQLVSYNPTHLHHSKNDIFIGYHIKDEITNEKKFIECSECCECVKELDNIKNGKRYSNKKNTL